MNPSEKISFRASRDFGETFNVSVKFIKQNFFHFISSIISIAGPFLLLAAIAAAFYSSNAISNVLAPGDSFNFWAKYGISFFIYIAAYMLASQIVLVTCFAYMSLYAQYGSKNFTIGDVVKKVLSKLGKIILVFLLITIFSVIIVGVFVGGGVIVYYTHSAVFIGLAVLAFIFGALIVAPPFYWVLPTIYQDAMERDGGVFESFRYVFRIMKGSFWWTWLIVVVALIAVGIISVIFSLPQVIYQLILTFSHFKPGAGNASETPIAFMIVTSVCTFLSSVVRTVIYIIFGFHYFSLAEKKEGLGLMERINEIGNSTDTNVEQSY